MAYNPNLYNPYQQNWQSFQQPVNGLVFKKNVEEAEQYWMPPNSISPALMLEDQDVFIVKRTDSSGGATLTAYSFKEIPLDSLVNSGKEYVTKKDLDDFMEKMMEAFNGKQSAGQEQPE